MSASGPVTMTKHTILFLAANPSGTDPRALDREARSIRTELKRSGYRDRFEFETRWAAEPLDLLRELRDLKPAVVHFGGRGSHDGLLFQTAEGRAQVVSPAAIAEAFGAAGGSVKVVVLSACYSQESADALLEYVDCVVGMGGSIHDDAARSFAIGFYGALGENESVDAAFRHGGAAINLTGLSDIERPQLKVRTGIDAAQLVPPAAVRQELVELPCPYPGMRPYSADDAAYFHGRSTEIEDLLFRLGNASARSTSSARPEPASRRWWPRGSCPASLAVSRGSARSPSARCGPASIQRYACGKPSRPPMESSVHSGTRSRHCSHIAPLARPC